ncbi:MAG: 2-iminobutanoate/2-iminopropanoate deaminase [Crocinitomicaceae bacterium]|jgi:2-iminobutanoate/2-iminopropanoate deaminase|nr:MAG: 2-iminobutanoate/2-iminopropanoate deaminase [Crocinitomicaceae bacterium]|tara:strand:+ start:1321 stop:1698 length:378 start_codon:yes stop_codon:yes gene_type:complete
MKSTIEIPNAPPPVGPYSQAIKYNGLTIASGQIAIDPKTGILDTSSIENETLQILKNIDALLEAGNLKRDNILKCSIFLKDMNDFNKVNEIYGSFFNKPYPSRETVEVARLPKDANIEISFIAGE